MDKLVMLKSSRYGLEIHLNPQAEFSKLLREMERKLKASIKFFEGAKMAVEFKDRLLSQAEEDQLLELISKTAGIDVYKRQVWDHIPSGGAFGRRLF